MSPYMGRKTLQMWLRVLVWFFETKSHGVSQTDSELLIFLPQPPKYWDYSYVPLCPAKLRVLRWEGYPELFELTLHVIVCLLIRRRKTEIWLQTKKKNKGNRDWTNVATSQVMRAEMMTDIDSPQSLLGESSLSNTLVYHVALSAYFWPTEQRCKRTPLCQKSHKV
jgi:hypothetical protein